MRPVHRAAHRASCGASSAPSDVRSSSTAPLGTDCTSSAPGWYSRESRKLFLMTFYGQGVSSSFDKVLAEIGRYETVRSNNKYSYAKGVLLALCTIVPFAVLCKISFSLTLLLEIVLLNQFTIIQPALQQLSSNVNRKTCLRLKIPIEGEPVRQRERFLLE